MIHQSGPGPGIQYGRYTFVASGPDLFLVLVYDELSMTCLDSVKVPQLFPFCLLIFVSSLFLNSRDEQNASFKFP